jgi:hypothetical protein
MNHCIENVLYAKAFHFFEEKPRSVIKISENNIDYKKIGIEKILERVSCNDENVLEMIGKIHSLETNPNVRHISLKPPVQWYDGVGPQTYTDYTIFTNKPMGFKEQEEFLNANGFPNPDVKPGHITLAPDYNEYYKYHFAIKTKKDRNELFVIDFNPVSDKPIKTLHPQNSRKGLYEVLFQDRTEGDIKMQKKILKLGKNSKVVSVSSKEPYSRNGFILSESIIYTKEQLDLKEQETLLKKYKLPTPIAKPDHIDFKNEPRSAGFYFRNDDWIQIFIIKFDYTSP